MSADLEDIPDSDELALPAWLDRKLSQVERDAAWAAADKPVPQAKPDTPPTWEELSRAARQLDREQAAETLRLQELQQRQKTEQRIEALVSNEEYRRNAEAKQEMRAAKRRGAKRARAAHAKS